jgi:hypothetical protein
VTFVGDDEVEGMDGDVQAVHVSIEGFVAHAEDGVAAKYIDGHALDGADVDEGVPHVRRGQVLVGHQGGVELLVFVEVLALEAVRVDLVDLIELLPRFGVEAGERAHRLRRQGAPVDQEKHPLGHARLHQAVNLVHDGERLARARGHGQQQVALALGDGPFGGCVRLPLVRPQPLASVWQSHKTLAGPIEVTR